MVTSTSAPEPAPLPAPSNRVLDSMADQVAAIDTLVALAQNRIRVFDADLSQMGWNAVARTQLLGSFLRRSRDAHLDIIVHDTCYLEASCPRLTGLLRVASAGMRIHRTGPEAQSAHDALVIIDDRHFLHRFHVEQPRAALGIDQAALAQPLIKRFEEIWATAEPGLSAEVLGL